MQILTQDLREKLLANGRQQQPLRGTDDEIDFVPVVKLFTPDAGATWLLTEIDPEDPDLAFGLCDLGLGYPEIGSLSLSELAAVRGRLGLPVERDLCFRPDKPLSAYASSVKLRFSCRSASQAPAFPIRFAAEPHGLGQGRARSGVIRRDHGIVRRAGPIWRDIRPV